MNQESAAEEGQAGPSEAAKPPFKSGWPGFGPVRRMSMGPNAGKQDDAPDADEDDKKIRFTIGGVGKRMNKEDFIREVQKLDAGPRRDVVDRSTASTGLKNLAKQDLGRGRKPSTSAEPGVSIRPAQRPNVPIIRETAPQSSASSGESSRQAQARTPSISPTRKAKAPAHPSEELSETAVERRRRLAVLAAQGGDDGRGRKGEPDTEETPAERRRRQAALGLDGGTAGGGDSDSDSEDEGTERVPPAERAAPRGIRFAEQPRKR